MHAKDLPQRTAAVVGSPRPVYCDVPAEVIARYRDGLTEWDATRGLIPCQVGSDEIDRANVALSEWATPERPGGGMTGCPPPGATHAIEEFLARSRS